MTSINSDPGERKLFLFFVLLTIITLFAITVGASIDLTLTSDDIQMNNYPLVEGEATLINATISNLGNETATDVVVKFLDDSIEFGSTTINISAFSTSIAFQSWVTDIGPNNITIAIDPDDLLAEADETNNQASKKINISAYHTYYGSARKYFGLGFENDLLFSKEIAGPNLLVTDTDCNVDFSSLQAIGRNIVNGLAIDDFEEIDILLNMTSFTDSISNLYLEKINKIRETKTFTVFGYGIKKVPFIESTDSGNFVTGMLWDTSDDPNKRSKDGFDIIDQEDLVFITEIKDSEQGAYGVYDYEIKIPALLRDYKPGSSAVDFYIDLDFLP